MNNMVITEKSLNNASSRTVDLTFNGRQLAPNVEIEVMRKRLIFEANGSSSMIIEICYKLYADASRQEVIHCERFSYSPKVFMDTRKKFAFPDWLLFSENLTAIIRKHIYDQILSISNSLEIEESCRLYPGFNYVDGKPVYWGGDKLIYEDKIKCYPCDLNYRLADYDIGPECIKFAKKIMKSDDPVVKSIFIASLAPYLQFFIKPSERARYDPVFFVHKKNEFGELYTTELCKVILSMYVSKDDPTRPANMFDVCCDPKDLNAASQFRDCALYLDGLRKTGVKDIDKKSKLNAVTVVNRKRGVNNSPSEGMNTAFSASVVISSDYLFDRFHLLTRCVVIPHDQKCKEKELTWFKEHSAYLMGIKILFIQYLESNYEELTDKVEILLGQRHFKASKYSSPSLRDSMAIMYVTAEIFLNFYNYLKKQSSQETDINVFGGFKGSISPDNLNSDELPMFRVSEADQIFDCIDDCIEYTDKIIKGFKNDWKQKLIDRFIWELTSGKASYITTDIDRFQDDILNMKDGFPQKFVYYDDKKKLFYVKAKHLERYFFTLDRRKFSSKSILKYLITDNDYGKEFCLIDTEGVNNSVHIKKFDKCKCRFISIREKAARKYIQRIK